MTREAQDFLRNYTPKSNMFTSKEEIELISNELGLDDHTTEDFPLLRNEVVELYTELLDKNIIVDDKGEYVGRTEKYWSLLNAMQSVTAVIDHYMYK